MEPTDAGASLKGRVRGMLHGVAVGDAMGATIEKLSAAEIRQRYGRVTSRDVDKILSLLRRVFSESN